MCHSESMGGRGADNLFKSVPSFHHVGSREQTQVFRLGSKRPHLHVGLFCIFSSRKVMH